MSFVYMVTGAHCSVVMFIYVIFLYDYTLTGSPVHICVLVYAAHNIAGSHALLNVVVCVCR